ncbi:MAG: hypothetical protein M1834_008753 [Cirrosporium novae-zelandiae]|nr:MAG: hypothetical protein M1834_008753 [Cirrosporium novae-zelandiae]
MVSLTLTYLLFTAIHFTLSQCKFLWNKTTSFVAFGDSYTYVQGTLGRQNYSFIGDAFNFSYTPQQLSSDKIVQNQIGTSAGGPNWVEYLTGCFSGLPEQCRNGTSKELESDSTTSLTLHHNYTVDLTSQIQQYLTYADPYLAFMRSQSVVAIWIGINDIGDSSKWTNVSFPAFYSSIISTVFDSVEALYDIGFRQFLFLNLPPLQRTPGNVAKVAKGERTYPNETMVGWWNGILERKVERFGEGNGTWVKLFDAYGTLNEIINDPESYGIKNVTGYCQNYDAPDIATNYASYGCLPIYEYFWYTDTGHITYRVHEILAGAITEFLNTQLDILQFVRVEENLVTMGDDIEERLKSHAQAFDSLLSLIPAKDYYAKDEDNQWNRKKQTKEEARRAKIAKLDPENATKSAKDVMDENARKRKRQEDGEADGPSLPFGNIPLEQPRQGMRKPVTMKERKEAKRQRKVEQRLAKKQAFMQTEKFTALQKENPAEARRLKRYEKRREKQALKREKNKIKWEATKQRNDQKASAEIQKQEQETTTRAGPGLDVNATIQIDAKPEATSEAEAEFIPLAEPDPKAKNKKKAKKSKAGSVSKQAPEIKETSESPTEERLEKSSSAKSKESISEPQVEAKPELSESSKSKEDNVNDKKKAENKANEMDIDTNEAEGNSPASESDSTPLEISEGSDPSSGNSSSISFFPVSSSESLPSSQSPPPPKSPEKTDTDPPTAAVNPTKKTNQSPSTSPSTKLRFPKADPEELRARLEKRIAELRAARKADGVDGRSARSRQELMEARRKKEEQRREHKSELRRLKKQEEQRQKDENLGRVMSPGGGSLLGSPISPSYGDSRRISGSNCSSNGSDDGAYTFGQVAFGDGTMVDGSLTKLIGGYKRKGPQDPETALRAAQAKESIINGYDKDKRNEIAEKDMWLNARRRARGERVRDDTSLLKKTLKRKQKQKQKSEKEWTDRIKGVEKGREIKQKKREDNLRKRREEKGSGGGKKGGKNGGNNKARAGFEGKRKV